MESPRLKMDVFMVDIGRCLVIVTTSRYVYIYNNICIIYIYVYYSNIK